MLTLTYRPGHGVTVEGAHIDAARDLMAAGMAWSARQRRWYAPASRLDPGRLEIVARALEDAGHRVQRRTETPEPTPAPARTPAARAHRQQRAARTAPAHGSIAAARAEIAGLTDALAHLPPEAAIVPALEARLDRARGRLEAWARLAPTSPQAPTDLPT